jgi:hypothetical protein|tara:strand:+ start:789 stop:962 length:174 start_codon:yes stop_codon:yes gene_type:complete
VEIRNFLLTTKLKNLWGCRWVITSQSFTRDDLNLLIEGKGDEADNERDKEEKQGPFE